MNPADFLDLVGPLVLAFGSPAVPMPQPLPPDPRIAEDAKLEREAAANRASQDLAAGGRQSTIFAGREIAMTEQRQRAARKGRVADDLSVM